MSPVCRSHPAECPVPWCTTKFVDSIDLMRHLKAHDRWELYSTLAEMAFDARPTCTCPQPPIEVGCSHWGCHETFPPALTRRHMRTHHTHQEEEENGS